MEQTCCSCAGVACLLYGTRSVCDGGAPGQAKHGRDCTFSESCGINTGHAFPEVNQRDAGEVRNCRSLRKVAPGAEMWSMFHVSEFGRKLANCV